MKTKRPEGLRKRERERELEREPLEPALQRDLNPLNPS